MTRLRLPDLFTSLFTSPLALIVVGLMVVRLFVTGTHGLTPDEAYYWLWSKHPDIGYYDHPPFVAWTIMVSTAIFGDNAFAVRLPALLSFAGVMWAMFDAAKTLFGPDVARRTLLWLNATLLLSLGYIFATPDPTSTLFWALSLWALARLITGQNGKWWLAVGLFAGLGVMAKYTNLFFGLGIIAWLAFDRDARRWWASPWPYLGGLVALIVVAPNLIWNAQHGWVAVIKQFGRVGEGGFTLDYLFETLLTQFLLFNPLIFVFAFLGGLAAFASPSDTRIRMLVLTALPLLAYMIWHALHSQVQGNWPAPVHPGMVLLAAMVAEGVEGKIFRRVRAFAAPLGIGVVVIAFAAIFAGQLGLMEGWEKVSQKAEAMRRQTGAEIIATTDYNTQSELSFHLQGREIVPLHERERYHWLTAPPPSGKRVLILVQSRHDRPLDALIDGLTPVGEIARDHTAKATYTVYVGTLR